MLASIQTLAVKAPSLMFVALLSQAGFAFGGITPLQHDTTAPASAQVAVSSSESTVPSSVLDRFSRGEITMPVVEDAQSVNQAATPASVPLPPALETGISGGATLILAAGLRKLHRMIRRGF